jgi:hypothetical protein
LSSGIFLFYSERYKNIFYLGLSSELTLNNAPADFLAQHDFFTPMLFRASVAAELVAFALANASRTASPS